MDFRNFEVEVFGIVQKAIDDNDMNALELKCNENSDIKTVLDQVFRNVVLESLSNGDNTDIHYLEVCINFCIGLCRRFLMSAAMPAVLLSDIFDILVLDKGEQMFEFVEANVCTWKEELFFTACKNTMLRMCNNLLRRLSRSQNTVFCGRILLFLAKFFPFSERSGLNIISEFNTDNVTEFAHEPTAELESYRLVDEDELDEKRLSYGCDFVIDYDFYKKFWSLHDYFRDPAQCYTNWDVFSTNTKDVLQAFDSYKLDLKYQEFQLGNGADKINYFPKYLTNQKLLELQLSDTDFRRYVLVQFLIIFQYLKSNVKFKQEKFELKSEQSDLIDKLSEKVYELLESTSLNGKLFAENIRTILEREENWSNWKNEGCKEFLKPATVTAMDVDAVCSNGTDTNFTSLGELVREAAKKQQFYFGSPELTKLWNLSPNNLESCKSKNRNFLPTLEAYIKLDESKTLDFETLIEKQYKQVNEETGNRAWKTLRLMARQNPYFFNLNNPDSSSASQSQSTATTASTPIASAPSTTNTPTTKSSPLTSSQ